MHAMTYLEDRISIFTDANTYLENQMSLFMDATTYLESKMSLFMDATTYFESKIPVFSISTSSIHLHMQFKSKSCRVDVLLNASTRDFKALCATASSEQFIFLSARASFSSKR